MAHEAAQVSALSFEEWEEVSKPYWLTVKGVKELATGTTQRFLFFHNKVPDIVSVTHTYGTAYPPQTFFKDCWIDYGHIKNFHGTIVGCSDDEDVAPETPLNWEVQVEEDMWVPLVDGAIPARCAVFPSFAADAVVAWEDIPPCTLIGLSGPVIRWEDLALLPPVYWSDEDTEYDAVDDEERRRN